MNRLDKVQFKPAAGVLGLALLLASTVTLQAQQPDPNMRAARLSYVEGAVRVSQGNQVLADPALVNTPLFEGSEIAANEDGKAEIQLDDGSVVRISPNSSLKIAVLRQDGGATKAELVLTSGLAYFELQGDSSADHTVARFGESAVTANGFTVLRVSLDNLPGEVAVFAGNAHIDRGNTLSLDVHGGESVALNASDPNLYNLAETIEPDSWDAWNADRDQDLTTQEAAKTAASGSEPNSNNPAWGELDANGNWYNVPGEGYVWSPNEAASGSWDPYGCGNWVSTPQFGYIWVSCEQWGYLPYTSGYWNYYDDFGWGWAPGYGYPWWTTGGWVGNIGHRPARYQPPHRPHGGPVAPHPPIRRGGFYQPNPVIGVHRIPNSPAANPVHAVGRPVTIGGTTVEPLRPLTPRPIYSPSTASGFNRSNPGNGSPGFTVHGYNYAGAAGGTYAPNVPTSIGHPVAPAGGYGGYHAPVVPSRGYSGMIAPSHAPSSGSARPSGGGGAPHASGGGGGGAPHVSSGGGGGGGAHAGGGGGHH
jgi:hypothetical protein